MIGVVGGAVPYVGNSVVLECLVELDPAVSYSEVDVEVRWSKAGRSSTIPSQETIVPPDMMQSTISFSYLLESHSGMYKCEATLTPRDVRINSSPLITPMIYNFTAICMFPTSHTDTQVKSIFSTSTITGH